MGADILIITARPPNFEQIHAVFPDADRRGVIFAYGRDIYNPSDIKIPAALLAHEEIHCLRQLEESAESWWEYYLTDPEFRYREELLAHAAEYRSLVGPLWDRNERAKLLQSTARRLTAPLYNYQPPRSLQQALRDLKRELE